MKLSFLGHPHSPPSRCNLLIQVYSVFLHAFCKNKKLLKFLFKREDKNVKGWTQFSFVRWKRNRASQLNYSVNNHCNCLGYSDICKSRFFLISCSFYFFLQNYNPSNSGTSWQNDKIVKNFNFLVVNKNSGTRKSSMYRYPIPFGDFL